MVHEQKSKDLLSSTCQVSPERIVDLESEVMRGPGSIPTGGNIFHWNIWFHVVKPLMPILTLLPNLFIYEKPRLSCATALNNVVTVSHARYIKL